MEFLPLGHHEVADQQRVEDAAGERAVFEPVDRLGPGVGDLGHVLFIGIAGDRGRRREAILDSDQGRAEDGREEEVGIDVAAGDAVFDAACGGTAARHADRGGAVVIGPADARGRVAFGDEAFVAVGMGRKDQREIGNALQAARDGVAQERRALGAAVGEDVVAGGVEQRDVGVQAVAGEILVRLGHEAGRHAVVAGKPAHQHLEEPGIVGRAQRVGHMGEVDLELAEADLGERGLGGDVHRIAGVIKVVEEAVEGVERPEREDFGPGPALARAGRAGLLDLAARVVDEVEFHLGRHHGRETQGAVAVDHAGQSLARVAGEGLAVLGEHPEGQERGRNLEPGHGHIAAFGGPQHAVGVADLEDEGAVLDILAPDVEVEHGEGEAGAFLLDLAGEADGQTLAARLAVEVCGTASDVADLGVVVEPAHRANCGRTRRAVLRSWGRWRFRRRFTRPKRPVIASVRRMK